MFFQFELTFCQLPRCFAGTFLLPLSLLVRPILKFWSVGDALLRFTWAIISERMIFVTNLSVTRNGLCKSHVGIGFRMSVPFWRMDFGGVMS